MFSPDMGGSSSGRLGREKRARHQQIAIPYGQPIQHELDWKATTVSDAVETTPPPAVTPRAPAAADAPVLPAEFPPDSPPLAHPVRDAVEQLLRKNRMTYIDVDEAKRVLFNSTELQCFHFAVYHHTGPNWLLFCGMPRKSDRDDLAEWQHIFGEGFIAVIAKQRADGSLHFETLSGDALKLA